MDRGPHGWSLVVLLAVASCGRIAFDRSGVPVLSDAVPVVDLPLADTPTSVCDSPRLVAHWRLDETSGATIVDAVGNNDGVWTDTNDGDVATEAATGQRVGALIFDTGSSVYVPGFVVPTEGTFAAWLTSNFDDSAAPGGNHPMVIDAPTPRTTITFAADIGEYGLRTNDVSWQASYPPPNDFTGWFHLAGTWSANGAQLYIDGIPVGPPGVTDARSTSPAGLYLGTRQLGSRWWNGLIDDVRFYDYAMAAGEVAELYGCP